MAGQLQIGARLCPEVTEGEEASLTKDGIQDTLQITGSLLINWGPCDLLHKTAPRLLSACVAMEAILEKPSALSPWSLGQSSLSMLSQTPVPNFLLFLATFLTWAQC